MTLEIITTYMFFTKEWELNVTLHFNEQTWGTPLYLLKGFQVFT